jgi:hypothetical protein
MAKNGTVIKHYKWTSYNNFTTTTNSKEADLTLTFTWNIKEQSVPYNYSTTNFKVTMKCYTMSHIQDFLGSTSNHDTIQITGCSVYTNSTKRVSNTSTQLLTAGKTITLCEGDSNVTHNTDGSFSPTLKVEWTIGRVYEAAEPGNYITVNKTTNVTSAAVFDTIIRRGLLWSAPLDFTDEDSPSIRYSVPPGMTGYIYLSLDGTGKTEDTHPMAVTGENTVPYVFTDADKAKLWKIQDQGVTKKAVKFYIRSTTTVDQATFREGYKDFSNLEIINFMPEFDSNVLEIYDTNTDAVNRLTGDKYTLIKYYSNAYFNTGAKGNKGATIRSQSVKNGDVTLPGPTGTFEKITSNEFHLTATDNYGRNAQETMQFSKAGGKFIDYVKLTCNVMITEMTAEGVATIRIYGKFYNGNFGGAKKKQNRLRVNYDLYTNGSDVFDHKDLGYADLELGKNSSWNVSGTDYEYIFEVPGLDYQSFYTIKVRCSDEIATEGLPAQTMLAATPIFDWGRRDFNFNVPVTIQGWEVDRVVEESDEETGYYLNAGGVATNGNYTWSYRKWSSGLMECWCTKNISTTFPSTWGSGLAVSGRLVQTNLIYPRTFIDTPVVTATLSSGYAGGILMSTGNGSVPTDEYSTGTLEIARGGSTTTTSYDYMINYMVKGRWK